MSYTITQDCIGCDRCSIHCPTDAIYQVDGQFLIDSTRCNDCLGYYGTPQCAAICPTNNACVPLPTATTTYWDSWFARYNTLVKNLKASKQSPYWEQWFEVYTQKLSSLIAVNS